MQLADVTIGNAQTASSACDLEGWRLVGIIFPAAFTGATVTLECGQALADKAPTTWRPAHTPSGAISIPAAANRHTVLDEGAYAGLGRFVRVVSASPEGAARTVQLVLRRDPSA